MTEGAPKPEQKINYAKADFATVEAAIQFCLDFWQAVDNRTYEKIVEKTRDDPNYLINNPEQTVMDRTTLNGTSVVIYRNHSTNPLTDKAISFLRGKGLI